MAFKSGAFVFAFRTESAADERTDLLLPTAIVSPLAKEPCILEPRWDATLFKLVHTFLGSLAVLVHGLVVEDVLAI